MWILNLFHERGYRACRQRFLPFSRYLRVRRPGAPCPGSNGSIPHYSRRRYYRAGLAGKIDANEERAGQAIQNAKFAQEGNVLYITTGPAVTYWNPANKATGNYTVKATFKEPKYMNLNSHPHPYGVVIAGNDLGTVQQSYLYCAAYGNGYFIVRGFGPAAFQMNGGGERNPAVNKAAGRGQPVTQEIAISVKGDRAEW